VHRRFGLSPDEYTAAQLRYDLSKLRAKGLIRKLPGQQCYVLTPKGLTEGTAIAKLKECLNGTVGTAVLGPRGTEPGELPDETGPPVPLQENFQRVRAALQDLLDAIGLTTAA
jgi:hypothetical protein